MKCHRWRQRVKAGGFIDNTATRNTHDLSFCIHAELISFSGEGEKQVKKVKMTGRLKYHIRSALSGCLCPGEMDSVRPSPALLSARTHPDTAQINALPLRKEPQVREAPPPHPPPTTPTVNTPTPPPPLHPSRMVQASS